MLLRFRGDNWPLVSLGQCATLVDECVASNVEGWDSEIEYWNTAMARWVSLEPMGLALHGLILTSLAFHLGSSVAH